MAVAYAGSVTWLSVCLNLIRDFAQESERDRALVAHDAVQSAL
jgi:hypothetical protein